jgi:hypothetical protein
MESAAASAFVKSVMGRLFMVLEKEYNKHKGLAHGTQSIQLDLRMIAAAMDDQLHALGRNHRTAVARLYREEMLDLAHDMEDCIDRFMHRLGSCSCKPPRGGPASVKHRVARAFKKVKNGGCFADEIHKLKKRLAEARRRVNDVIPAASCTGQPTGSSSTAAVSSARPSCFARNLVGIAKPMEDLLSLLDEVEGEPAQLRVISTVGFRGLGKTTLARQVYDQAKAKFDCRAWVAAAGGSSETSDGTRILRDILQQVRPRDNMDVDTEHTETSLKEYLKDKRCV